MKSKFFALVLAVGFMSIGVFGFAAMIENAGSHAGCIAATAQRAVCPNADPLDFIAFHLNAFRLFSTAVVDALVAGLFLVAALFLGWTISERRRLCARLITEVSHARARETDAALHQSRDSFIRYLSRFELSPTLA